MTKVEIDILKKALFIIGREEVETYKALPDDKVIFSKEFEKKAYAINKRRKSLFYRTTKTVPRKIAEKLTLDKIPDKLIACECKNCKKCGMCEKFMKSYVPKEYWDRFYPVKHF